MPDEEEVVADDAMIDLGDDDLDLDLDGDLDFDLEDDLLIEDEIGMEFESNEIE
jgi:hypothetical protein